MNDEVQPLELLEARQAIACQREEINRLRRQVYRLEQYRKLTGDAILRLGNENVTLKRQLKRRDNKISKLGTPKKRKDRLKKACFGGERTDGPWATHNPA